MAYSCTPRGDSGCVLGEWDADTAEPAFTAQLLGGFQLVDRCALLKCTKSAHEVTVWGRRSADGLQVRVGSAEPDVTPVCRLLSQRLAVATLQLSAVEREIVRRYM